MTDAELNRAVAEARGWRQKPGSAHQWIMPDARPSGLPDVANDPAAWGALFVELAAEGWNATLRTDGGRCTAQIWRGERGASATQDLWGRALALAFLKAVGR